jgi:hypothetical protein
MSAADKLRAAAEALLLGREEKQRQELEAAAERIRQEAKKQGGE